MNDNDIIRKAVMFSLSVTGGGYTHDDYDAAMAALDALCDRADRLEKALQDIRAWGDEKLSHISPVGAKLVEFCDAALAEVPAEPATEEKP